MIKIKIDLKDTQTIEHKGKVYKITIEQISKDLCICGCGKPRATTKSKYAADACRKRVSRRKKEIKIN